MTVEEYEKLVPQHYRGEWMRDWDRKCPCHVVAFNCAAHFCKEESMTPEERIARCCPKLHGVLLNCYVCDPFVKAVRQAYTDAFEEVAKIVEEFDWDEDPLAKSHNQSSEGYEWEANDILAKKIREQANTIPNEKKI